MNKASKTKLGRVLEWFYKLFGRERKCPLCRWSESYTEGTNGPLWECTLRLPGYVGQGYFVCTRFEGNGNSPTPEGVRTNETYPR